MNPDFTFKKYAQFCRTLQQLACPVMTAKKFLDVGQPSGFTVILRHDIDRRIQDALAMARLEARYEICATYYVRMTAAVFKPDEIREFAGLGHEVGYHYEALAKARGDVARAKEIFERELNELRQIVSIDTISMHGSPLSPWNNLDLWKTCDYHDYNITGEFSLSIDYARLYYFTDTGRSWDADRYNIRDRVPARKHKQNVHTTEDLIEFLHNASDAPVLINTHPNRWAATPQRWCISTVSDFFINRIKWIISRSR